MHWGTRYHSLMCQQFRELNKKQIIIIRDFNDITKWNSRDLKLVIKWCRYIINKRKIKKIRGFFKRKKKNK